MESHAIRAVIVEGGILPKSIFDKSPRLTLPGQKPADYGLAEGENLHIQISSSFGEARKIWNEIERWVDLLPQDVQASPAQLKMGYVYGKKMLAAFGYAISAKATGKHSSEYDELAGTMPVFIQFAGIDEKIPQYQDSHGRHRSAFEVAQEFVNLNPHFEWAALIDSERLRFVKKNKTFSRPSYFEVDFSALFDPRNASEFRTVWLLCHSSRFPGSVKPCWINQWIEDGSKEGERALDRLAVGVCQAIECLGSGFLSHPSNEELRARLLESDSVTKEVFYRDLLTLTYRLIFMAVAEERSDEEKSPLIFLSQPQGMTHDEYFRRIEAYKKGLSIGRLRNLTWTGRANDRHEDAWESLKLAFNVLSNGCETLSIGPLGGLFEEAKIQYLNGCKMSNIHSLAAIENLSQFHNGIAVSLVNWRDIGSEEIGGIYERLLGLTPRLDLDERTFSLSRGVKGNERKISASYYTPSALVDVVIKHALESKIEQSVSASTKTERETFLLDIKVIDPACGSGHFLIAAARAIAEALARVRNDGIQPSIAQFRYALHDVCAKCIYGVDKNPMAIELARTSLWLESCARNRPLTFVDHHLIEGDGLIGIQSWSIFENPAALPSLVYKATNPKNSEFLKQLGAVNRKTIAAIRDGIANPNKITAKKSKSTKSAAPPTVGGQQLFAYEKIMALSQGSFPVGVRTLINTHIQKLLAGGLVEAMEVTPNLSIDLMRSKREALLTWTVHVDSSPLSKLLALYFFAFFSDKEIDGVHPPTIEDLSKALTGDDVDSEMENAAVTLMKELKPVHWPISFPAVFMRENPGFDVVLGNPPWEKLKISEKEWFQADFPEIAALAKQKRSAAIEALRDGEIVERQAYDKFQRDKRYVERATSYCLASGRFPLTGKGDLNLYSIFTETAINLIRQGGRAGLIVPTGVATDDSSKELFGHISSNKLVAFFDFENREKWFDIDSRIRFSVVVAGASTSPAKTAFYLTKPDQIEDERRVIDLQPGDIPLMNPNTKTMPLFRSKFDADLTRKIYLNAPILIRRSGPAGQTINPWGVNLARPFDMSNDSACFKDSKPKGVPMLPLYEAKLFHHYDHRFAAFDSLGDDASYSDVLESNKCDTNFETSPRYWVSKSDVDGNTPPGWTHDWLIAVRKITRSTDERTLISSVIPKSAVGDSAVVLYLEHATLAHCLLANLSSLICDYVVRQKLGGTNLNHFYTEQFPILPPSSYSIQDQDFLRDRVGLLTFTSTSMTGWAKHIGYKKSASWNPAQRRKAKAEIDAFFAKKYGLDRRELEYILYPQSVMGDDHPSETFRIMRTKEMQENGKFEYAELVLNSWDALYGKN